MASRSPSSKIPIPESAVPSRAVSATSNVEPSHLPLQSDNLRGPVAILWDIENCSVPSDVQPEDVAGNIRLALRVHPLIRGAVTMFSAYGDFNAFPRRLREGCQRTGVKLVDVPNGRKDAADKAILVDMFLFALDNRPPSSIMLISGDVDFAPALHILGQRGYTVILIIPSGGCVSSALCNAGQFVWDWPSIARGEGFVSSGSHGTCGPDLSGYPMSRNFGDCPEMLVEDEAIVYKGSGYNSCSVSSNCSEPFKAYHSFSECSNNNSMSGAFLSSSRLQCQPSGISEALSRDQNSRSHDYFVQPGDIQGLKGQLVRLLETFGGSLLLVCVPSEYLKCYGRPLYMSEYGVLKLVHLANKMADTLILVGKGPKKLLCLRNSDRHAKKYTNTPIILKRDQNGKEMAGENANVGISPNPGSSSDDSSDDERNADAGCEFDDLLEGFKMEMQELPVCYSCPVPLNNFEALYEQRYCHTPGPEGGTPRQHEAQPRDNSDGLEPTVSPYLNPHYLNLGKVPKSSIVEKKIQKKTIEVVQSAYCAICKVDCYSQEILKSHKYGKKHKNNLQKLQDSIKPKPTKAQTIAPSGTLEVAADDEEKLQCKVTKSKVTTGPEDEVDLETKRKRILEAGAPADEAQPRDNSDGLEPTVPPYLNPQYLNPGKVPKSSIVEKKILKKTIEVVQSAYCAVCKVDCNSQEILKSHKYGKKHRNNLQKLQDSITPKPTKAQTIAPAGTLEVAADDEEKLQCKETKSKVTTGPEDEVDLETKLKRILEAGAPADEVRVCTICNVAVNSQKVYENHLEGQKHAAMVEKLQEAEVSF